MLIALIGLPNAGKSTLEQHLHAQHNFIKVRLQTSSTHPHPNSTLAFASSSDFLDYATQNWRLDFVTCDLVLRDQLVEFLKRPFVAVVAVQAPVRIRYQREVQFNAVGPERPLASGALSLSLSTFVEQDDTLLYGPSPSPHTLDPLCTILPLASLTLSNAHETPPPLLASLDSSLPSLRTSLRPDWDSYFMLLASLASLRSNCMKRRVGAVLVRSHRVVSTGYNGTPRGVKNCGEGGCGRCNSYGDGLGGQGYGEGLGKGKGKVGRMGEGLDECLCLHAEENALLEAGRERVSGGSGREGQGGEEGATLYCNTNIYLKLDNAQPSGSFKLRGVGALAVAEVEKRAKQGATLAELVCSSGGNAGLACAYAARMLGLKCTVVVPLTTSPSVISRLQNLSAIVIRSGAAWDEADKVARDLVASNSQAAYIHPFEGDELVEGHSTLVKEVQAQLKEVGVDKPDAVVCSVGGGGLLGGILRGLTQAGWSSVPVVFCETPGASCLHESLNASYAHTPPQPTLVTLPSITSIATTLGAKTPSLKTVEACLSHPGGVVGLLVSDKQAVEAVVQFAADHQILVEPACGVCFAPVYDAHSEAVWELIERQSPKTGEGEAEKKKKKNIVIVVCGGSGVDLEMVMRWREMFREVEGGEIQVRDFRR